MQPDDRAIPDRLQPLRDVTFAARIDAGNADEQCLPGRHFNATIQNRFEQMSHEGEIILFSG